MSAERVLLRPRWAVLEDPVDRHVLRYALGASMAMAMAAVFAWPLAHVAPVFSLMFLANPGPPPSMRQGFGFVAMLAIALFAGLWVIKYLSDSSFVFFVGMGLVLYRLFYAQASGAPPALILLLLVALLVLPMVAVQSPDAAVLVAFCLVLSAAASLLATWLAHGLIPETRPPSRTSKQKSAPKPSRVRFNEALDRWVVVFPLVVLFQLFEWSGAMITLIFIAILAIQPGFEQDFKAGLGMILGNAMGGLAAIVGFHLLTVVPTLGYLLLISFFGGLWFGSRLLRGGSKAPLFGMAYSTMLLLLGSSTASEGDATSAAWTRVLQIMIAVVYVVVAFGWLRRYREAKS